MRKRKEPENRRQDRFRGFWLSKDADTSLSKLMSETGANAQTILAELVKHYAADPKFAKALRQAVAEENARRKPPTTPSGKTPRTFAAGEKPTRARPVGAEAIAAFWAKKKTQ